MSRSGRPARFVMLGILSAIVGALGIAANVYLYRETRTLYRLTERPPPPPPPPAPPALTPYRGDYIGARGLPVSVRNLIVAAVERRTKLLSDRREMLRRFLADGGQDAFPAIRDTSSANGTVVTASLLDVMHRPSGPDGDGLLGTDVLRTTAGAIEINNQSATFIDHSGRRAVARASLFIDFSGNAQWSAAAIDWMIEEGHYQLPAFNTLQAAAVIEVAKQLPVPQFSEARVNNSWWGPIPISFNGMINTTLSGNAGTRNFWVLPDGRLVYPPAGADWDPSTGRQRVPALTPAPHLPVSRAAAGVLVGDCVLSLALSIVLLVCSLAVVADASWAAEALRTYALAKLLVVAVTIFASCWIIFDWDAAISYASKNNLTVPGRGELIARVTIGAIVWLAYPAVVLLTLSSANIRGYVYQRAAGWPSPAAALGRQLRTASHLWTIMSVAGAALVLAQLTAAVKAFTGGVPLTGIACVLGAVACALVSARCAKGRSRLTEPVEGGVR